MHNLLHCAAVCACHFRLAAVAIRADADRIYLYGNVKVVVVGRGRESTVSQNTKMLLGVKQQNSHRGLFICQLVGVNRRGKLLGDLCL